MVNSAIKQKALAEFHITRSVAIQEYARLELAQSVLLAALLGSSLDQSATIFYSVSNAKSRNRIIQDTLRNAHGETYAHYWHGIPHTKEKGIANIINSLDQKRNEIVHWVVRTNHKLSLETGALDIRIYLDPATNWFKPKYSPKGPYIDELEEFCRKARFAYLSVEEFTHYLRGTLTGPHTWPEIFQQPCAYPPPDTHPLHSTYTESQIPPLPSEA